MPPSCTEILDRFRRGDLAPSTLLEQTLATIDALDDELGAFV